MPEAMNFTVIPKSVAIIKLKKVPIIIYSVFFWSFVSFKSPKRKTDFAANKKPIVPNLSNKIKEKIKIRSIIPIHLPASFNPFSSISICHFSVSFPI